MLKSAIVKTLLRKILILLALPAVLLFSVFGIDLSTYRALTDQAQIMRVSVAETDAGEFQVSIQSDGKTQIFFLSGDMWQIDFHLLRFAPWMALGGINHLYQPIRLSNRYSSISDQREKPSQFYSLRESDTLDDWSLVVRFRDFLPIDALFGASVFMPLKNQAEYEILIGFSGLVVKSLNNPAYSAVQNWHLND